MTGKCLQAIRGMNDVLPSQTPYWQYLESSFRHLVSVYGYQEIRFPIVEMTQLFSRAVGEVTDIVEKEMYTFSDRNGDSLSLRPEGTAGCVRAGIEHGLLYNQQQRLWYYGPMFRHERPQKGRYRQFYQFGVEAFGMEGPDIDAEQIIMMARFWRLLGIQNLITLQINSLGDVESRVAYKNALTTYFEQYYDQLDEECQHRLKVNPLRILDSKNPEVNRLFKNAPVMSDYLDEASQTHFNRLKELLDIAGVKYEINPRLVRGLDYYGMTIYEWVTESLGAQGTVCAGGRYDRLVEILGGKATSGIGFAMGIERIVTLIESVFTPGNDVDIYFILVGEGAEKKGISIAEKIRDEHPLLRVLVNCGGGSFKSQFKRADKLGAKVALIIGEDECQSNLITVKYLREEREQQQFSFDSLSRELLKTFTV